MRQVIRRHEIRVLRVQQFVADVSAPDSVFVCTLTNPLELNGERYHMILNSSLTPLHDFRLTGREEEIAELLATGLTAKQIALQLKIANETVRSHTRTIYLKLRVKNKVELTGKMFRMQQQKHK
jgi:DNA-binding NarL/FixJ family response regulator